MLPAGFLKLTHSVTGAVTWVNTNEIISIDITARFCWGHINFKNGRSDAIGTGVYAGDGRHEAHYVVDPVIFEM